MSRKHHTLLQSPSTLESTHHHHYYYNQSPSLSSADISFPEDEFGVPTLDHDKQQQHSLYLIDTVVNYSNNEEGYHSNNEEGYHSNNEEGHDDISSLDDQFTDMEINTPDDDRPQDPYQAHQPYETMAGDTFIVDSSGTTVAYVDPAASPNSDYSYCKEHFGSISGSIYVLDTPMTPAEYGNAASNSSSTYPHHQQ